MITTILAEWNPERDLAALLDALANELRLASDRDVATLLQEMGEGAQDAIKDMRRRVAAADAESILPPVSNVVGRRFSTHVARNQ